MSSGAAIGIMCKAPIPGVTKTRLSAAIGAGLACALSESFLRDVASAIEAIPESYRAHGIGVYAPAGTEDALRRILPPSFRLLLQVDSGFGNVLFGATERLLQDGHDCVLLVNGDSPTLPTQYLADAVAHLRRDGDRVVLGPASDGGYYLIGLKRPHRFLFDDIPWSTATVMQRTLENAARAGLEAVQLPEWYDVDDQATYDCLRDELAGTSSRFRGGNPAVATRACLASATAVGAAHPVAQAGRA